MSYLIQNRKPASVFHFFEDLCAIPHPSYHEEKVADYLCAFAAERGLECYRDNLHNVLIKKPATPDRAGDAPILFQGHTDMVCVKTPDCDIDFMKDGLTLYIDGNLLRAKGTTLGADDGIAVATMLALLDGELSSHPALECLFTSAEEVGLDGAEGFDYSKISARKMINMDSEDLGIITAGCAGGLRSTLTKKCASVPFAGECLTVSLQGLFGGHSGVDICSGRANANKLMGRLFAKWQKAEGEAHLISLNGGSKDNAIPRLSVAEVMIFQEDAEKFAELVKEQEAILKNELHASDAGVTLELTCKGSGTAEVLDATSKVTALHALNNIPNGIQAYSKDIEGLVETSLNMGIMTMDGESLKMSFAIRSSIESAKHYLTDRVLLFVEMLGGNCEIKGDYPGWAYNPKSELRETFIRVYREMYEKEPVVEAIHAGLECGLFTKKIDGLDSISVGPNMHNVHTSEETLEVASVQRTWEFLCRVIAEK